MIGWNRTEETGFDRPTTESMALDEAGLVKRARTRLGTDPTEVIKTFREAHPGLSPWDLWILIGTECPRGVYTRELAKRKVAQGGAPAYVYRFEWETPAGGGHMHSPHSEEIPFAFNNINAAPKGVSEVPEAQILANRVSAAWAAFARTGDPNTPQLPKWPAYSVETRDTMILNNESRVESDPDRAQRLAVEKVLKLS
jgi:para-nitrobenzyl esterase